MIPKQLEDKIDEKAFVFDRGNEESGFWVIPIDKLKEILEKYFKQEIHY